MIRKILFFFILLISLNFCLAIGIVTDDLRRQVGFEPGSVHEFDYFIRATTSSDAIVQIVDENSMALSQYITLSQDKFYDLIPGKLYHFKVTLTLPDEVPEPGSHVVKILVSETELEDSSGVVAAKTSSSAKLTLFVPYPGKFVRIISFSTPNVNEGEEVKMLIRTRNYGTEEVRSAKASVSIFSGTEYEHFVTTVGSSQKSIAPSSNTDFNLVLPTEGLPAGSYKAIGVVDFDGDSTSRDSSFNIGTLFVKLVDYTQEIEAGKINRFDITVESSWNNRISNLYAVMDIPGYKGEIKTPTTDLEPFKRKVITAYIDAERFASGQVSGTLNLHYEKESSSFPVVLVVKEGLAEEVPRPVETPAEEGGTNPFKLKLTITLSIIVAILLIINIITIFRRKANVKK